MKKNSELLYWLDFKQYIHYDSETNSYTYDPKLPERAKMSHIAWLKQRDD